MTQSNQSCRKTTLAISLALVLVACNGNSSMPSEGSSAETENKPQGQGRATATKKMKTNEQVAFSREDLAVRLDADLDTISLSGATPVTWRSGALGCPKPGMSYTEALVPGIWIMLRVGNKAYRYHAKPSGQPFYCPDEWAEPPVVGYGAD